MSSTWDRMMRELRNPKKAALIIVLLVVGLLLWGRLLLKQVPRTASAGGGAAQVTEGATDGGALSGPILPREADKPTVRVALAQDLQRDLFALPRGAYEPIKDERTQAPPEKSAPEPTDESQRRSAVRQAAAELSLQSVVSGEQPRAVINGQMLAKGQRIDGFTVVQVAKRFVLIRKDGVTVRLNL